MDLSIQIGPLINLFIDGSMQIELLIIFQESFKEMENIMIFIIDISKQM